jgi:hypothetical protein
VVKLLSTDCSGLGHCHHGDSSTDGRKLTQLIILNPILKMFHPERDDNLGIRPNRASASDMDIGVPE